MKTDPKYSLQQILQIEEISTDLEKTIRLAARVDSRIAYLLVLAKERIDDEILIPFEKWGNDTTPS